MTLNLPPLARQSDDMTPRARAYLATAAVRHFLLALACVTIPDSFTSSSFDAIRSVLPLQAWGVVFFGVTVVAAWAVVRRSEPAARLSLIMSASSTAVWAGGLVAAYFTGTLTGPSGPIIWWAVVLKDLIVCRQPMRSPFEPLVRSLTSDRCAVSLGRLPGLRRRR